MQSTGAREGNGFGGTGVCLNRLQVMEVETFNGAATLRRVILASPENQGNE